MAWHRHFLSAADVVRNKPHSLPHARVHLDNGCSPLLLFPALQWMDGRKGKVRTVPRNKPHPCAGKQSKKDAVGCFYQLLCLSLVHLHLVWNQCPRIIHADLLFPRSLSSLTVRMTGSLAYHPTSFTIKHAIRCVVPACAGPAHMAEPQMGPFTTLATSPTVLQQTRSHGGVVLT